MSTEATDPIDTVTPRDLSVYAQFKDTANSLYHHRVGLAEKVSDRDKALEGMAYYAEQVARNEEKLRTLAAQLGLTALATEVQA